MFLKKIGKEYVKPNYITDYQLINKNGFVNNDITMT